MVYDIAFGLKRTDRTTKPLKWEWSELVSRLREVVYCDHDMLTYKGMSKKQKGEAKDKGFFIGGLVTGRNVTYRQILSLDIDHVEPETLDGIREWLKGVQYVIHSTHSSTPDEPRYRVVVPLNRFVLADEYGAIMRILSDKFKLPIDPSTFDFKRIMYLPSVPKDASFYIEEGEGEPLNVADLLDRSNDWRDLTGLSVPDKVYVQDPKYKGGLIGAFCSKIGIHEAVDIYLSDVWKKEANNRYTFIGSSTVCGGIIYEDKYLYSNHSTDPYLGRCHNAYDAVRLYKFGEGKQGEEAMRALCESLKIKADDGSAHAATIEAMPDCDGKRILQEKLEVDKNGVIVKSLANVVLILENDPEMSNLFGYDLFGDTPTLMRDPFWRSTDLRVENEDCKDLEEYLEMEDVDDSYIRLYFEQCYSFDVKLFIRDALNVVSHKNAFHPVRDYIEKLEWDGVPRLANIFIDCFGVDDTLYSREVGIKFFVGAVRRIFIPSSKMDYVPVLVSEEGLGKSRFVKRMSKLWGSDTFYTFSGSKEAYEQLRGVWIVEIPELNGVQSRGTNSRKAFVTKGSDRYRSAYLHYVKTYKRQCVFIASSNDVVFLDDPSEDGRRWWGLMCDKDRVKVNIHSDEFLELVNKYWAEAFFLFKQGVLPVLSDEADAQAVAIRKVHKQEDAETGALNSYLLMPVPENWYAMDVMQRIEYWEHEQTRWTGTPRECICTAEVAREFYGFSRKDLVDRKVSKKVSDAIRFSRLFDQPGYKKSFGEYGNALAWVRNKKEAQ